MTVNDFVNAFVDASVNIQLVNYNTQIIIGNGSKLNRANIKKYMTAKVKTIRLDSWINKGKRENEIELGISI